MCKEDPCYHTFLSFKGETRDNFTCFLYEALRNEGFLPFMDKTDIHVGDEVNVAIKEGIRNSMSAIIIFSPNYASSTWCLEELVLILQRMKTSKYFIIPIFYEVRTRDIKHQLGNYSSALEKHRLRGHGDKVEKWKQALDEVGNILGEHVRGLQSTFIRRVVKLLRENMADTFPGYHLPVPKSSYIKGDSPPPSPRREPSKDKVILYTTNNVDNGAGARNRLVMIFLAIGNVVFEERNCSKEPRYLRELEELVGKDGVRFPMVIVNGKDLCGEGVEGLDDYENKHKLVSVLKMIYKGRRMKDIFRTISGFDGSFQQTMQIIYMQGK
ncbi:uncharacterized protein LOC141695231 isoform X2 [Apium graveolens]|uniref:uncharacterized protein LOC141695231 isoform X2 n=1 Tax=Apium graveolens TaxID=4045 RepID=UPI003D79CC36